MSTSEAISGPQVGDDAPDFTMQGTQGDSFTLSGVRGQKRTVLIFYPQDQTSGCRAQLAAARDVNSEFQAADTLVFGVNEAGAESHQLFIEELGLPFDLLIDEGLHVATAYDALKPEGGRITRTVYVVGKNGKVLFRAPGTPTTDELLAVVRDADDA